MWLFVIGTLTNKTTRLKVHKNYTTKTTLIGQKRKFSKKSFNLFDIFTHDCARLSSFIFLLIKVIRDKKVKPFWIS